jgi:hypothetical protein
LKSGCERLKIGMPLKGRYQIEDRKSTKGKLITSGHGAHKGIARVVGDLVRFLYTTTKPREDSLDFGEETQREGCSVCG